MMVPAQAIVAEFLKSFQEFPPSQRPASFSIDEVLEKATAAQDSMALPKAA
jgi:arylsulfatase